jgi:hypothetical protein
VALGLGLDRANLLVRVGVLGILLASGVLGALVQYSVATQALAIADDLSELPTQSATARQTISFAPWMNVARFVTPTIFVVIFIALAIALLVGPEFGAHGRM